MKFLRLPEVEAMVALKKTAIYKRIQANTFPAPIRDGGAARWRQGDVEQYMLSRQPAAKTAPSESRQLEPSL
jgi:prophage regulatory protein